MSSIKPITLEGLFRFYTGAPHQIAAIRELEADIAANGFAVAMDRRRSWYKTWSTPPAALATTGNLFDRLKGLLDLIAAGEGDYCSINRGVAGDTPGGYPGLDRLTIGEVQALQGKGFNAVGRYQFIPSTLRIALGVAGLGPSARFSPEHQDWLAITLLLGGKRPVLRDYLLGKDVAIEDAQKDLAFEWASIPMANGRGAYDGDTAGNRATSEVKATQQALRAARAALQGRELPPLRLPLQQEPKPALPPNPPTAKPPKVKVKPRLVLTRTGKRDQHGLEILQLQRFNDGVPMGVLTAYSGGPRNQVFRRGVDSRRGSGEPLPEGLWSIGDIDWKAGKDNYSASWGPGLGAAWVPIEYQAPGDTERSAIGFHLDENVISAPGSDGCVVFRTKADLASFIAWLRSDNPRQLYVDWGLGSCPKP
jgi:hypothetical protein